MPEIIDNIQVGMFIKTLLRNNNMTQDALAQKLMISKSAVSQNLNGKSSFDIQNLMSIAKIFNLSLDDLLNCRENKESDDYISEYVRFANKGLEEIQKHKSSDLQIQEPDIYGKVFIDYLIDQDIEDIFIYLNKEDVEFVQDYYHRAKEIYLKIIIYMLRKDIAGVIKYIKRYAQINNSFDIIQSYNGLEIWNLIDKDKNIALVKQIMELKISQQFVMMGMKRKKEVKVMTQDNWIECIGVYKLTNVLEVYINNYARAEELFSFTSSMLLYEYSVGVEMFIDSFFTEKLSYGAKSSFNFQKTATLVVKKGNFNLFKKFIDMYIYESLTNTIVCAIDENKKEFYEYCLLNSDNKVLEPIDYSKLGSAAIRQNNIQLIEIIKNHFDQNTLNFLISEVNPENTELLYYLVSLGAKFDFKYYNSNTMKNCNAIIDYLYKKGVK
ncbi:MAG: helix-turn-helix transcriptional regulator [Tenericutes bacterium]|nr:helix-turn-helix transcriptional regulator [Mycoplasmatota bacterium]